MALLCKVQILARTCIERSDEMDLISRQDAIDAVEERIQTLLKDEVFRRKCGDRDLYGVKILLQNLPSAQQWIPCSERLPKEDGRYLCTYKDIFYGDKNFIDFGLFDDGQWIVEPLAWMPLPQPWKEVKDEQIH